MGGTNIEWSKSMAEKYNEYAELVEKLKCYIGRLFSVNHIKDDEIKDYLSEFGLYHILSDFFQDSKIRKQIKIVEAVRKMINEKILSEIGMFASFAEQENIKIICLKGVLFGYKYYPCPEKRMTGDIDIFLDKKDFKNFVNMCREHGYTREEGKVIKDARIEDFISGKWRDQHFDVIVKGDGSVLNSFTMDIHERLFQQQWFGGLCHHIPRDFYNRSKLIDGFRGRIYEFEVHDMLIYHQLHFIQHLFRNIWTGYASGEFYFQKRVNLIFEVACIVKNSQINWMYYIELCLKYQINMEIAVVCVFVNQIFGEIFPNDIVKKLISDRKKYKKDLFYDKFSEFSLNINFADILMHPVTEILKAFNKTLLASGENILCPKDITEKFPLRSLPCSEAWMQHVEYSVPVSRQMMFETILHWNEKYFIVDVKAEYQGIALEKYLENDCQMKKDCISVILFDYTMKSETLQARAIDIYLYKQRGIVQCKTEYENIRTTYLQQFEVFRIEIPWDISGISPVFGDCFGFNMRWQHLDDKEQEPGEVSIIDNPVWHDVVSMRHIILMK